MDLLYYITIEMTMFRLNGLLTAGYYFCANLMEYANIYVIL